MRWTVEHVVAVVEVVCGIAVAVWLSVLGSGSVLLTVFGLAAGAALVIWGARRWRRANAAAQDEPAQHTTAPPAQHTTAPPAQNVGAPPAHDVIGRPDPAALSPDGERELARVVAVLADVGVFAPRAPDPQELRGPVADYGEPVTAEGVLSALHEASYYVPGFDAERYTANLAFHVSHGEQFADVTEQEIDDIVRLAAGDLADVSAEVELGARGGTARVPTRIRLTTGTDEQVLVYDGAIKYLSTVVHVALARLLRERRTGRRLAWLWSDQGVWLSALPDDAVTRLNAALGPATGEGWEWVDEQDPVAAGDSYPA